MKKLLLFLIPVISFSQANTEVYLFDISKEGATWKLTNEKNISNNKGYDSQPHFYDDNTILFASNRNGETDIAAYNITTGNATFINNTPNGGEYSPQRIPSSKNVSAVRLDKDGKQRFYKYNFTTGQDTELIKDLVVAYPMWYDKNTLISSVIVNDSLQLVISDVKKKTNTTISKNIGRSFHKIPNSKLVSFVKKSKDDWEVWSLNPTTKETKFITRTGITQDICWLPDGSLLIPYENTLFKFNPKKDQKWSLIHLFENEEINNISRVTVNKDGTKLALVAEVSPRHIVQKQLDAYNNRDIDAFLATYTDNVKVYSYPNELRYEGKAKMREAYTSFFNNTPDLHCKILKRIVSGNKVIDEEYVTANGENFKAVAIYEITNGKISAVRFL
ncbi:nuclear transport factor 2 family protein [Tenacibaculum amylolyticum]|uniref:nuclear transport factor 2 family protein n=1 Tax=Tenacibaculum amylolyticum TaxID=104269 RepID=UPI003893A0BD